MGGFRMIKNNELNAIVIAKYFLTKDKMTQKKVQKLVFYAYAWYIVLNNDSSDNIKNILFDEVPEAWMHGPVFPTLYEKYKYYNWLEIPKLKESIKFEDTKLVEFLDKIWFKFGVFTGDELEYMTHQEDPWFNARMKEPRNIASKNKISLKDIFDFYSELARKYGCNN